MGKMEKNWHGSWRKSEVKRRWSMKQGIKSRKVHFASEMGLCHLKNSEWEPQYLKYKGRVALRGDIVKDDSGSYAVLTEQGSTAPQMTAAKVMDIISRHPGNAGQAADAVPMTWLVMHRSVWKDNANWRTRRLNNSTKYPLCASMTITSKRKKQNLLENCHKYAFKLFSNVDTWHELEGLIFYGQWTNLHDRSQNGPNHVTNARIDWYLAFITQVHSNTIVMWVILQNKCRLGLFQDSDFAGDLEDSTIQQLYNVATAMHGRPRCTRFFWCYREPNDHKRKQGRRAQKFMSLHFWKNAEL